MKTAGAKLKPGSARAGARGEAKRTNTRPAKLALSATEIALLRRSFARIERQSGIAALVFYRHLFTLAPSLRALFQSDIELQGRKLMEALSFTIETIEDPDRLTPVLEALGRRHVSYGARDEHYDLVITALMLTLEQFLARDFTPAVARAWRQALTHVADIMKRGAAPVVSLRR